MSDADHLHGHRFCPSCFEAWPPPAELCPSDGATLVPIASPGRSLAGRLVDGKYMVTALLGRGGMGEVYRARQLPMNREVALKVLFPETLRDVNAVRRFVREASAASRLHSRHVAMIHDFGISREGFIYLVMELAEGRLLSDSLIPGAPFGLERSLHVAIDVCRALEEAHAQGIVHRDLKPGNIILDSGDGHEIARVLDFGTAYVADTLEEERVTADGKVFGTPAYMCPEQAQGEEVDAWADLYSLGIMLYEMLSGALPYTGKNHTAVLLAHINSTARPLRDLAPEVPQRLAALVEHLMAKHGRDRPAGARRVRLELEEILEETSGAPPQGHRRSRTVLRGLPP
ncbi:MAG: serine/threonine protein kinase, partial [Deltaproteobacteria bacterium]|nr:serine/threonine protein kinase [Deltaproteobacteria bacterium]